MSVHEFILAAGSTDVAKALASAQNLADLEALDCDDRGLRDVWETLVVTGRRCSAVFNLRLECIDRHGKIPLLWHDQTKVGNFDEGIRISEWLIQSWSLGRPRPSTASSSATAACRPPPTGWNWRSFLERPPTGGV
ncbi:hypothetical protein OH768_53720 [Streptomyces sp. NBC_01622]|uniref:hypothetical protein n=1 Tax=Streptomyces sp. NBC_01622 TaxID=2975903 RepID=UPI003864897D|nr:hypothetical protein OH768_53720 [Streptomyces sp. NBC_01622]